MPWNNHAYAVSNFVKACCSFQISTAGLISVFFSLACQKDITSSPKPSPDFSPATSTHVRSDIDVAQQLLNLTGQVRTKLVWLQARLIDNDTENYVQNVSDYLFNYPASQLVAFDTDEKTGRFLDSIPAARSTPVISRDGTRVLWSDYDKKTLYCINWDGSGKKILLQGTIYQIVCVQWDKQTSTEWVYVSDVTNFPVASMSTGTVIYRYAFNGIELDTANRELASQQNFVVPWTVSGNGKFAGSIFGWPKACIESLPCGQLYPVTDTLTTAACHAQIAPDTSYLFFCFSISHFRLTLYKFTTYLGWVGLNAYNGTSMVDYVNPRWTNNVQYLTVGYPYCTSWFYSYGGTPLPSDPKSIGPGLTGEFCFGKFDVNIASIQWVRITDLDIRFRKAVGDGWLADGEGPGKTP